MRTRIGWGSNFMAKFSTEGATKGSEPDAILTPATEISSTKKQEARDMEIADASSIINQENPTAEIDITKIMHSMKRGKRSTHQRVKISAPWAHPFGFLNSSRVRGAAHRSSQGVVGSKTMKRTRWGTRSRRVNTRAGKGKGNAGGEEDSSSNHYSIIPAEEAAASDSSRVESAPEPPPRADSMASCVEFAVKILKDEIPLPAEASVVEELLKRMIFRQRSEIPGPSQSSLSRKI